MLHVCLCLMYPLMRTWYVYGHQIALIFVITKHFILLLHSPVQGLDSTKFKCQCSIVFLDLFGMGPKSLISGHGPPSMPPTSRSSFSLSSNRKTAWVSLQKFFILDYLWTNFILPYYPLFMTLMTSADASAASDFSFG